MTDTDTAKGLKRYWALVDRSDGCWLWQGKTDDDGYGRFSSYFPFAKQCSGLAHRIAWLLTNGDIPEGQYVLHSCDTPPCCNPDHLFLGTQGDNMRDRLAKGRMANGWTKNAELMRQRIKDGSLRTRRNPIPINTRQTIRLLYTGEGISKAQLARRFAVSKSSIARIVSESEAS